MIYRLIALLLFVSAAYSASFYGSQQDTPEKLARRSVDRFFRDIKAIDIELSTGNLTAKIGAVGFPCSGCNRVENILALFTTSVERKAKTELLEQAQSTLELLIMNFMDQEDAVCVLDERTTGRAADLWEYITMEIGYANNSNSPSKIILVENKHPQ